MRNAIFCLVAIGLLCGCDGDKETTYLKPERKTWDFSQIEKDAKYAKSQADRNRGSIETLENILNARSMPSRKPEPKQTGITLASHSEPAPSWSQEDLELAVDEKVSSEIGKLESTLESKLEGFGEKLEEMAVKSSSPQSVVESAPPVYSNSTIVESPQTYSGPVSYGNARYSGTRTKTVKRRVAKTVYEEVDVPVQVPVKKVDVFQTVERQVPYQATRTVMETVMVPKQVARQVSETKYRTVSERVKVGEKEVEDTSYAAAPSCSAPVPTYTPAPSYSAPRVSYQQVYSAPAYSQVVECAPAPVQSVMQYAQPVAEPIYQASQQIVQAATPMVETYSVPVQSLNVASSGPCNDPNCQACNPSYSTVMVSQNPKPPVASQPTFGARVQGRRTERRTSRPKPVQGILNPVKTTFQSARPVNREGSGMVCAPGTG